MGEKEKKVTKLLQIFKCEKCGNIVEVIHANVGELVCCNQPMKLYEENSIDASLEKHVPVYEINNNIVKVKVGSIAHPMEGQHYIEWIEIIDEGGKAYRQFLKPGQAPEAEFCINISGSLKVRELCNIHGLWKA
jgi:superoxide reductase